MKIIELTEYSPHTFDRNALPEAVAETLWRTHSAQVAVQWPTVATDQQWRLAAQGWVGFIPFKAHNLGISLLPKVPLSNLFAMLEMAYELESLQIGHDLFEAESLPDFAERLALILARRVQSRCRRGIYRQHVEQCDLLSVVRGRIDIAELARQSTTSTVALGIPCRFDEQSADVIDNQILLWTLHVLIRGGLCSGRSLPTIRSAFRTLSAFTSLRPISAQTCRTHLRQNHYNRFNQTYRTLHALCLFLLEQSSPSHCIGDQSMLPFVVNMAQLYERFVAKWLAQNIDSRYRVQAQERHNFTHIPVQKSSVYFEIDLVVYERDEKRPRFVMDTKYKVPVTRPDAADVAQVLAYAQAKNAPEAVLIYPVDLPQPIDFVSNGIRVRSATFGLDGNLFKAGNRFLGELDVSLTA